MLRAVVGLVCLEARSTPTPPDAAPDRGALVSGGCLDARGAPHRATSERWDSFRIQLVRDRLESHTGGAHPRNPISQYGVVSHACRSLATRRTHTSPGALGQPLALPLGNLNDRPNCQPPSLFSCVDTRRSSDDTGITPYH